MKTVPKSVLGAYAIGAVQSITQVTAGLVHETFAVKTDQGRYIIQKLHPVLASKAIGEDFFAVTEFLRSQKFLSPVCVRTKKGEVLSVDQTDVWRMQTLLPGRTIHVIESLIMAREAGQIYARFHKVMDKMDYRFKSKKILHETEKVYEALGKATKGAEGAKGAEVAQEVAFIRRNLPEFFLPADLPLRVIHGDPKISNILFDRHGRAKAIIDLDTCNRRPLLVELGDAFRSWCGGREDDPSNTFSLSRFRAAWKGYEAGAQGFLTRRERQLVPRAIGTITLELAARFLTDYFTDNYFGWDASRYPSRASHNLARARGQIAEFKDYQKKLPQIKKIVEVQPTVR
ncbi:phosphotransferase [Candidatus Uhrbacteria bacterium]|nr:phosphotransferase [Candidatus Uhrbacteria bacterium]